MILGSGRSLEKEMVTCSSISCLENHMDREAWWATVHEVAKSQTQLSTPTQLCFLETSLYSFGIRVILALQMSFRKL